MFEKEAEKYVIKKHHIDKTKLPIDFSLRCEFSDDFTDFQKGAEFGYNKAFVEADKNLKAIFTDFQKGAEFVYNKAFVEADKNLKAIFTDFNKAKELIQDLIDSLEVIDGEQIRELKVVKEAEQFLLNIERYENGK